MGASNQNFFKDSQMVPMCSFRTTAPALLRKGNKPVKTPVSPTAVDTITPQVVFTVVPVGKVIPTSSLRLYSIVTGAFQYNDAFSEAPGWQGMYSIRQQHGE